MATSISKDEFKQLYAGLKQLRDKQWDQDEPPHHRSDMAIDILGHSKKSREDGYISIRTILQQRALDGNVGYLYNLWRAFENSDADRHEITVNKLQPFLILTGYENITRFSESCNASQAQVKYLCLYYSLTALEIREFILTLVKHGDGRLLAISQGFHDAAPQLQLTGHTHIVDKCLLIRTEKDNFFLDFNIYAARQSDRKPSELPQSNVLQGFINANSSYEFPLSLECVLIKQEFCTDIERINASRYLFLKRNYHRVAISAQQEDDTRRLRVNHVDIDKIGHMAGRTYRIWTYAVDKKEVLQSKFTIDANYKATIKTPSHGLMNCFITINTADNLRLLVSAYKGTNLLTYTILNVPPESSSGKLPIVQGVFCTVGHTNHNPVANYFVMMEEKQAKTLDARFIPLSELNKLCKSSPGLEKLRTALDHICLPQLK